MFKPVINRVVQRRTESRTNPDNGVSWFVQAFDTGIDQAVRKSVAVWDGHHLMDDKTLISCRILIQGPEEMLRGPCVSNFSFLKPASSFRTGSG
ncbi:hypothetical protein D3C71_1935360 [compost metagenome]